MCVCLLTECLLCLCVWSFRRVWAVGVYLFKLLPMTKCSLFRNPECRIKPQSRAATSKLTSRLPHLCLSRRTLYCVNKTQVELWKILCEFLSISLLNIYRAIKALWQGSTSICSLATLVCRPNNINLTL